MERVLEGRAVIRVVIALAVLARIASADDEIVAGSVVKIEAKEIYVTLGRARGVAAGAPLRIKRTISLRHPVTGVSVQDWIPIGAATVTEAGADLSRAVVGELVAEIKVGDLAEVLVDRPDPPRARATTAQVDPATAEVLGVFAAQTGQSVDGRIATWERYLSTRGGSPFAEGIRRDLDELRALRDQLRTPLSSERAAAIATLDHQPPHDARAGQPFALAFVLQDPQRVAAAYLHVRPRGAPTYHRILLTREHDVYLRGVVPAAVVTAPGVDYFVEVATPSGATGLALASPDHPVEVGVAGPALLDKFGPAPGRSTARLAFDYLDFATFDRRAGDHRDRVGHATVDLVYRMPGGGDGSEAPGGRPSNGGVAVESFGVGYGVYAGRGGFGDATDARADAFHYGYASLEVGGFPDPGVHVSFGAAAIAGVGQQGFGMGGEGHVRLGDRDATNLMLSGRSIDQVGFLSELRLGTRPVDDWLVGVSVGATNQPNDGDIGVKLGVDTELVRYRNASLSLRGSWQGRSIDHGGVGGGAGLGVSW
jgi:hypothetical protein